MPLFSQSPRGSSKVSSLCDGDKLADFLPAEITITRRSDDDEESPAPPAEGEEGQQTPPSTPFSTPSSPREPSETVAIGGDRWLKMFDAFDKKGFISDMDVYNSIWSVGIEPSSRRVVKVLKLLPDQVLVRPSSFSSHSKLSAEIAPSIPLANQVLYDALDGLFSPLLFDFVKERFDFWTVNRVVMRPDSFVWQRSRLKYMLQRLATLNLPFTAFNKPMIPRFTLFEEQIFLITNRVLSPFAFLETLVIVACIILRARGFFESVTFPEIFTIFFISNGFVWGAQASREASYWCHEARTMLDANRFHLRCLRFQTLSSLSMKTGDPPSSRALLEGGEDDSNAVPKSNAYRFLLDFLDRIEVLDDLAQDIVIGAAHEVHMRKYMSHCILLRSNTGDDESCLEVVSERTLKHLKERFDGFSLKFLPAVHATGALIFSLVPTIIRYMSGRPSLFSGDYSLNDKIGSILLLVYTFLAFYFCSFVILKIALSETKSMMKLGRALCDILDTKMDIAKQPYKLRLDNVGDVLAYDCICRAVSGISTFKCAVHVRAIEVLGVVSLLSALLLLFSALFLDVKLEIWSGTLFASGAVFVFPIAIVLYNACEAHDYLSKGLVSCLRSQRRQNSKLLCSDAYLRNEEASRQLQRANLEIDNVVEHVLDREKPIELLGFLSLRKERIFRLVASISIVLFSFLVRSSFS